MEKVKYFYNFNVIHNKGMNTYIPIDESTEQYSEPSVTDKESYRLTLASIRGFLSNPVGTAQKGVYSIPAGKNYDPNLDFSFLNRKDLTIVDIDNYISRMKAALENSDNELKLQIEEAIAEAESRKKTDTEKVYSEKTNTSSEG